MTSAIPFSMDGCPSRLLLLLKGECMNQKSNPHKPSSIVGDQNDIWVLGLCRLVSEVFEYNGPYCRWKSSSLVDENLWEALLQVWSPTHTSQVLEVVVINVKSQWLRFDLASVKSPSAVLVSCEEPFCSLLQCCRVIINQYQYQHN